MIEKMADASGRKTAQSKRKFERKRKAFLAVSKIELGIIRQLS